MKRHNSTRVKAPDYYNPPVQPSGLHKTEQNEATTPKPIGRYDEVPRAGVSPCRAPIGRAAADKPKERKALLTTKSIIGIGTWNVRTLYQSGNLELLLHQLNKFKWEIIGVSETHWTESGEFATEGYQILCSGYTDIHRAGVAFILNKVAQQSLLGYNHVSSRLLSARFKTVTGAMTVIQVYAPNMADKEEDVDQFYDHLQVLIGNTPGGDMLIVMGDLNSKVGKDWQKWNAVMGRYGYGDTNARGEKLLSFCAANNLHITNTMFKQAKDSRQWTWESPDGKTRNKIDYVMINNKWKTSISNSRSFPSADVGSDHQLVISDLRVKFKKKQKAPFQKTDSVKQDYEVTIGGKFAPLMNLDTTDVEDIWTGVKIAFNDTSNAVLGSKKSNKQEQWISEEVIHLSKERSKVKLKKLENPSLKPRYNYLNQEIKRKTKGCKDMWIQGLCTKVEHQAAKSKEVYATIKVITKKPTIRMQTIKSKDGRVLTGQTEVKTRWKENYDELYNENQLGNIISEDVR
ncbi:craniofacial development protein 2-like [Amphiura filiformis]|uniref:craniofacial development protein 2-like n=1 Tax=Amphiura filiformis TaxID=82378 RepID=UPI003B22865E